VFKKKDFCAALGQTINFKKKKKKKRRQAEAWATTLKNKYYLRLL
jgi:hypothetical protein